MLKGTPKIYNTYIVFFLFSIIALTLSACGRHHHDPEEKMAWVVHRIAKKLDLNEDQKLKLDAVKVELLAVKKHHHDGLKTFVDKLISEIQQPEIDQALFYEMVSQQQKMFDERAPKIIEHLIEFHASLSDEQKQIIVEKLQHLKKHHSK